jgi:hypothetical protein
LDLLVKIMFMDILLGYVQATQHAESCEEKRRQANGVDYDGGLDQVTRVVVV